MIFCFGIDFGTDSVRAILVDARTGDERASSVFEYPRWKAGLYCNSQRNQFRQHPLDHIEGLEYTIRSCLAQAGDVAKQVLSISITSTGSTPIAIDGSGTPLSLQPRFAANPNAMFLLWKDHSAIEEASEINEVAAEWPVDYLKYAGGVYSPEWFWAKMLYVLRQDEEVRDNCYTWIEHCDWIPFLLTGGTQARQVKRNVCAAGHKALWAAEHNGFPSTDFFRTIDPLLEEQVKKINAAVFTADEPAGTLCEAWAERLGLPTSVQIGIGAIDAHVGAIGAQIAPGFLTRIIGTSTCDMLVVPKEIFNNRFIKGICGQVDGSIIPGMIGLEAGQSAFGDVYSWFRNLLLWPLKRNAARILPASLLDEIAGDLLRDLDEEAGKIDLQEDSVLAIDWFNGRRTPDVNLEVKAAISQLSLGTDAPQLYAALVESTCFGARMIVERFREQGLQIDGVIGVGGIARKSPFVMQTMADVLNMEIRINRSEQICAMGAAMLAAVVAGVHRSVEEAMKFMGAGVDKIYHPRKERAEILDRRFEKYKATCSQLDPAWPMMITDDIVS